LTFPYAAICVELLADADAYALSLARERHSDSLKSTSARTRRAVRSNRSNCPKIQLPHNQATSAAESAQPRIAEATP
jgi:hypothetical protein